MKKIYEFKGLNKKQKKELKKDYIKSEWKNFLISYIFIILSSSKPFFSSTNGAIFVLIWFTLVILWSAYTYVNQSDYMKSQKISKRFANKHKNAEVEEGFNFSPEIGGWTSIATQVWTAILVYFIAVPISLYLQFKNFEIYKEVYMNFFIGIFADTYIVAFCNGIVQIIIEFINDCANNETTLKKTIFVLKLKDVICCVGATIILCIAFTYYLNKEFGGLFGDTVRKIVGSVYIIYMLYPLIKCIKQVIDNKKKNKANADINDTV